MKKEEQHVNYEIGESYRDVFGNLGEKGKIYHCVGVMPCPFCLTNLKCSGKPIWLGRENFVSCNHWYTRPITKINPETPQDKVAKFRDKIRKEVENNGN